jgi:protein-S-isoprenylcysteine O-methyltransferase Ste14
MKVVCIPAALGRVVVGIAFYGLCLFLAAGTIDWPQGWLLLVILAFAAVGEVVVLAIGNRPLLSERSRPLNDPSFAQWDRRLTLVAGTLLVAVLIMAGLDHRFGWTPALPPWVIAAAAVVAVSGNSLFLWAMASNRTFFRGARIDHDHHAVSTAGPYRAVRHPGYLGAIAAQLGQPVAAATLVALVPAVLAALVMLRRTRLEDRFLIDGLAGYAEFAQRTRFRLLPLIW